MHCDVEPLNHVLDFLEGFLFLQVTVLYSKKDKTRMCRVINFGVELATSQTAVLRSADPFNCFFSRLGSAGLCKTMFCSFDGTRGFQDEYELQYKLHLFVGLFYSLKIRDLADQLCYYFCCYLKSKVSCIPLLTGRPRSPETDRKRKSLRVCLTSGSSSPCSSTLSSCRRSTT